jgi:hypothetical protein
MHTQDTHLSQATNITTQDGNGLTQQSQVSNITNTQHTQDGWDDDSQSQRSPAYADTITQ